MTENEERDLLHDADDAYRDENYSRAIMLYEKVLSLNPQNQRASVQLTKARISRIAVGYRKELPIEAVQSLSKARSYINDGDFVRAIDALNTAIQFAQKLNISYPDAEKLLSSLYSKVNSGKLKVFISYSREDIGAASNIYWLLHEEGYNVWMDNFDLIPGQNWKLEIHKNIRSSDFFIACLSKNSVSKRGYVQKELKEAIAVLDEMPEGEIYIIPLRLDDCSIPSSLSDRHWLDWFAPYARQNLLKALKSKE